MKIIQIHGYTEDGATRIDLAVDSDLSVAEAISSVLALFAGQTSYARAAEMTQTEEEARTVVFDGLAAARQQAEANVVEEPAPKAEKATRTRRPRTNPDAAPAPVVVGEVSEEVAAMHEIAPVTERRRTRVTAEPAAPEGKTITDADLAKACSNAAAITGHEVVQAVIADKPFYAATMHDIAPELRERFLAELEIEIEEAKKEAAKIALARAAQ